MRMASVTPRKVKPMSFPARGRLFSREVAGATGEGVPLFTAGAHPGRMRLEQSTAYPSGILELVYAPASRR